MEDLVTDIVKIYFYYEISNTMSFGKNNIDVNLPNNKTAKIIVEKI